MLESILGVVGLWLGTNLIAVVALLLSMAAFAGQFLQGRRANLSVFLGQTPDYKGRSDRLMIVNRGPAAAKNISLRMTFPDGGRWKPYKDSPFPIKSLAPGTSFIVPISTLYTDGDTVNVALKWRDRRLWRQTWTSSLSTTGELLGSGRTAADMFAERDSQRRQSQIMYGYF